MKEMKDVAKILFGSFLTVLFFSVTYVFAATQDIPSMDKFSPGFTQNASRACKFPIDGWTIINCSNVAAATSAELNDWSRYVIQCGDDSYIATGDESTDVADTNDGYLPEGSWLEFITDRDVRYISCLNINVDSDCRIWECK